MITNTRYERVYLARGSTDLRKSIDGLAVIVKECFNLDPFSPCLFVFCNRKRDKLNPLMGAQQILVVLPQIRTWYLSVAGCG